MPRSQLAINCPAPLLERLRAEAQRQQTSATSLVLGWLEAGLDGHLEAPRSHLEQRLEAVEQRLDALERFPKASPKRGPAIPPTGEPVIPQAGDAITTAELAEQTGTNKGAWNTWATKASPGDIRHHAQAGSWRLLGKTAPASGGPPRWLWEQA